MFLVISYTERKLKKKNSKKKKKERCLGMRLANHNEEITVKK